MRLILHAGTHKTGTTTIQKVLYDNRDWFRQNRLFYPVVFPFYGKRPHHRFGHALASGSRFDRAKARLFIAATKWQANAGDTVVISSEPIYRHVSGGIGWDGLVAPDYWERRQNYLRSVAEVLSDFDVEIVLCFREFGYYLAWLHRMMKKYGAWEGSAREFRTAFADRFEYDRQIEAFRLFFPEDPYLQFRSREGRGHCVQLLRSDRLSRTGRRRPSLGAPKPQADCADLARRQPPAVSQNDTLDDRRRHHRVAFERNRIWPGMWLIFETFRAVKDCKATSA